MIKGGLMLRGVQIFRGAPDAQRALLLCLARFLGGPRWSEGPRLSGHVFWRVSAQVL